MRLIKICKDCHKDHKTQRFTKVEALVSNEDLNVGVLTKIIEILGIRLNRFFQDQLSRAF